MDGGNRRGQVGRRMPRGDQSERVSGVRDLLRYFHFMTLLLILTSLRTTMRGGLK